MENRFVHQKVGRSSKFQVYKERGGAGIEESREAGNGSEARTKGGDVKSRTAGPFKSRYCKAPGTFFQCLLEYKFPQHLWKLLWQLLKIFYVKHRTSLQPSNSTTRGLPGRNENICAQRDVYVNVHAALFPIARRWKRPRCPSADEQTKETWYVHTTGWHWARRRNKARYMLQHE